MYTRMSSAGTMQALSGSNVGAAAVGGSDAEESTLCDATTSGVEGARSSGEGARAQRFEGRYVMS